MKTRKPILITHLILLFCLVTTTLSSQNYMIPFREKSKWGYADAKGKIVVTPQYSSVSPRHKDLQWTVYQDGKASVIDSKGTAIPTPADNSIYSELEQIYDPKTKFEKTDDIIESQIDRLIDITTLKATPIDDGHQIEIGRDKNTIVKYIRYEKEKGKVKVSYYRDVKLGLNQIEEALDEAQFIREKDKTIYRYLIARKKDKWGIFDLQNDNWIVPLQYSKIEISSLDLLLIYKKKKVGIFNYGEKVQNRYIAPIYDEFLAYKNIPATDEKDQYFYYYLFKKKKKACVVGENLVEFYE